VAPSHRHDVQQSICRIRCRFTPAAGQIMIVVNVGSFQPTRRRKKFGVEVRPDIAARATVRHAAITREEDQLSEHLKYFNAWLVDAHNDRSSIMRDSAKGTAQNNLHRSNH